MEPETPERRCRKCGHEGPPEDFAKGNGGRRRPVCKTCHSEYVRRWREERPEASRQREQERYRRYRQADPEAARAYQRSYADAHKERIAARMAVWYQTNRERLREHRRRRYQTNREAERERERLYAATHKEQNSARKAAWYQANKDRIVARRRVCRQAKGGNPS